MLGVVYDWVQKMIYAILHLIAPFHPKISRWVKGRKNWKTDIPFFSDKTIWFHLASLGEYEQALPVIRELEDRYPHLTLVLTFFSPSGYDIVSKKRDHCFYLPLDTQKNAQDLVARLNPALVIFTKYDLWYQMLRALERKNVPTVLISAVFHKNKFYFKWYGRWMLHQIRQMDQVFVQTKRDARWAREMDIPATLSGDSRLERSLSLPKESYSDDKLESFIGKSPLLVLASTHQSDIEVVLPWLVDHLPKDWKMLIAPHEIKHAAFEEIKRHIPNALTYSDAHQHALSSSNCLIDDRMGVLKYIYRWATAVYVGGGFGPGIHNILEPLAYQCDLAIGPEYHSFYEAVDLKKLGGIITLEDPNQVNNLALLFDPISREKRLNQQAIYLQESPQTSNLVAEWVERNLDL